MVRAAQHVLDRPCSTVGQPAVGHRGERAATRGGPACCSLSLHTQRGKGQAGVGGWEGGRAAKPAPAFVAPNRGAAHGLHPRFVVAEIWADRGASTEGLPGGGRGPPGAGLSLVTGGGTCVRYVREVCA